MVFPRKNDGENHGKPLATLSSLDDLGIQKVRPIFTCWDEVRHDVISGSLDAINLYLLGMMDHDGRISKECGPEL